MTRLVLALTAVLVLGACGTRTGPGDAAPDDSVPADATPAVPSLPGDALIAETTVLEGGGHGPQLCLGGVMESYPPQCGGPDLVKWDWARVGGFERASGTTWGQYVVVGTYDAARNAFRLTQDAVPASDYDGPRPEVAEDSPLGTPCDEPEGGWRVQDPALTTDETLLEVQRVASRLPGFAGFWYDQSINPAYGSDDPEEVETSMNDPEKLVVNVAVTGDVTAAEDELRVVWGGALCVSQAEHTEAELRRMQNELNDLDGMLGSGSTRNHVEIMVVHDDGSLQQQLDETYGPGVVVVTSALQPYPG